MKKQTLDYTEKICVETKTVEMGKIFAYAKKKTKKPAQAMLR